MVTFIVLIAVFLLIKAVPSLRVDKVNFFTSRAFLTDDATDLQFGIRDLLTVTVLSSALALLLAVPTSIGIAIFLTHYAPKRLSRWFSSVIDLLAAVPSIVFGLWGIFILAPRLEGLTGFLNAHLGWFPLFKSGNVSFSGGGNIFTAGIVLAVMILPIITSVTREVYRRHPGRCGHLRDPDRSVGQPSTVRLCRRRTVSRPGRLAATGTRLAMVGVAQMGKGAGQAAGVCASSRHRRYPRRGDPCGLRPRPQGEPSTGGPPGRLPHRSTGSRGAGIARLAMGTARGTVAQRVRNTSDLPSRPRKTDPRCDRSGC